MSKQETIDSYWEEAKMLADAPLPIPPRVCLDSNGRVVRAERCLQCPMKTPCELEESGK